MTVPNRTDSSRTSEDVQDMEREARERTQWLKRLRNIRHFLPAPIPEAVIADILEVARWTGSAKNTQPWEFMVIRDPKTLDTMSDLAPYTKHLRGAAAAILIIMDGREEAFGSESFDEGRLTERMMLAADAHGLGSSIGWFEGESSTRLKELLGIPPEKLVRTALSLGYPNWEQHNAREKRPQARKPLAASYERYGQRPTSG